MVLYEFQARDGKVVERDYPMLSAPKIGTVIVVKGKRYRRIMSRCAGDVCLNGVGRGVRCVDYAHEAVSMPNVRHGRDPAVPRYSKDGFPVFLNKREIREFEAKRPQFKYDTGRGHDGFKK